jgi:hypothetical protein
MLTPGRGRAARCARVRVLRVGRRRERGEERRDEEESFNHYRATSQNLTDKTNLCDLRDYFATLRLSSEANRKERKEDAKVAE